jgi:toxin HigB-1
MIRSFRSSALRRFAESGDGSRLSIPNTDRVRRILQALNAARRPQDMDIPGYGFHALKGDLKGRYAIRARGNWRITFAWHDTDAIDVDLEDYH